ncbi:MAG TPA: flavodoxin-dependent (E)-4-hydroxy-3-methylbut-2-enyl-diphosphate synthase, partial [Chloroflexota bacterium]|nr:flavodoxin-dependent (E)-4-hydroxy-3-methylbut-2-enyl-diphosphate synthase [Chloroflexota bacterium]
GDTPEGMVESALEFLRICEKYDYFDVILSMKASNPKIMIAAYRLLAARMSDLGMTYPFHLGVTEAGNGIDGRIKSTIGIGSLLADGIGDTIRVSLTEEPEEEVPVAFTIANHFTPRDGTESAKTSNGPLAQSTDHPTMDVPWDAYHYSRRATRATSVGPIGLGGDHVIAVVVRAGADPIPRILRWAGPGARRLRRPDIVELPIDDATGVASLETLNRQLAVARALPMVGANVGHPLPQLGLLASGSDPALLEAALDATDAVLLTEISSEATGRLARATATAGKPLWLEMRVADDGDNLAAADKAIDRLLLARDASRLAGQADLVLTVTATTPEALIVAGRRLATRLAVERDDSPVFLRGQPSLDRLLPSALPLGSLLCDGVGDAVQAGAPEAGKIETELTLDVLQGAGTRLSKTDYVACPSCGRTLFDLQSTTERIKEKTSHLVGVKIAIMGCVVNGPGEMADADFGYVGGTPGHVNLYVGKTCVERAVPAEIADETLIELIKARGRWHEPEPEEAEDE